MKLARDAGSGLYSTIATPLGHTGRDQRPHASVVERIEEEIGRGRLVRGQKLPTEQQLAAHFGVTRGIIREAIKVLEARGLVEAQQGSGIYVRNDPIPALSRALTLSITPDLASVLSLFEIREPLEVLAAELAAQRRTERDLAALQQWVEAGERAVAADDFAAFGRADEGFHLAVVEASGNPYLRVVLGAVLQMRHVLAYMIDHAYGSMAAAAVKHEAILAAIASGDGEVAGRETRCDIRGGAASIRAALAGEGAAP